MTTERWRRVQAAFLDIADLPQDQQSEALNRLGLEIREEVAAMLAADDPDIDAPIDEEWEGSVHEALSGLSKTEVPERVGPYRIVRELGRGGMGIVYLAERADGQFEQTVALKLVKRGMDTDAILSRFLNERQVLASLQHPHIARLYDGGVTKEGQPWFAMEYVDGHPITDYCDEKGLTLHERLELFLKVCHAVRHAHNRLIIHRDLKPSNILVTDNGEPHLLDFGLAKVLQDPTGDPATTRREQRWMTLEYASPEQVKRDPVGTPSDTYQLGLVLYEMLTGKRAYTVKGLSSNEAERVICDVDPPRPSTAVATDSDAGPHRREAIQRKRLKGDLDTIILNALHKDPARGYASAETLATDIQHHLDGLPIQARPDTLGYRAGKFVRRHRWGTAVGGFVTLLVLSGSAALLVQNRRIARESERARLEADKAGQVTDYLVGIFEASDPSVAQGDTITARELLERGLEQADALGDQPELQATLLGVTGRIYNNLGNLKRAETVFRQSLIAWDGIDRGPEQEEEYTQTLFGLALAIGTGSPNRYADVEPLLRRVIERREAENVVDRLYQEALSALIVTLYTMGRHEAAGSTYAKLEATLERVPRPAGPNTADHLLKVAAALSEQGQFHGDLETLYRGQRLFDEAIRVLRTEHTSRHSRVGFALNMLAENLIAVLDLDPAQSDLLAKADSVTLESVLLHRTILPDLNPTLTRSLRNRAVVLRKLRRYAEAEESIVEALNIAEAQHGKEHYSRVVFNEELARIQLEAGNYAGAVIRFADMRDWWIQTYGNGHLKNVEIDIELAAALTGAGRFADAETYLEGAYETLITQSFETQRNRADRDLRTALQHMVDLYTRWDKPDRAADYRTLLVEKAENE